MVSKSTFVAGVDTGTPPIYITSMSNCPTSDDLREVGNAMIGAFDKRVATLPKDLCGPFHQEARQLESELLTVYKMLIVHVRREQDLAVIAVIWETMVGICDAVAKKLNELTAACPPSGAEIYYDRVLDLRNKCSRLQMMHS
jgi:hypothetical protein